MKSALYECRQGDVKCAYDCDKESCEMADRLITSVKLQELKMSLAESHPDPIMPETKTSKMPSSRRTHSARRPHYPWISPSRMLMCGIV
jgi:hypothetical protein